MRRLLPLLLLLLRALPCPSHTTIHRPRRPAPCPPLTPTPCRAAPALQQLAAAAQGFPPDQDINRYLKGAMTPAQSKNKRTAGFTPCRGMQVGPGGTPVSAHTGQQADPRIPSTEMLLSLLRFVDQECQTTANKDSVTAQFFRESCQSPRQGAHRVGVCFWGAFGGKAAPRVATPAQRHARASALSWLKHKRRLETCPF